MKKLILVLLSLFILSGCNSIKPTHHLEPTARQKINDVDAFLIVDQDEIYGDIEGSNITAATGGGLLFALIDVAIESSQTDEAEESVSPIRDELIDYDYADVLWKQLGEEFKLIEKFKVNDLVLERAAQKDLFKNKHNLSKASATLFLTAKYFMSPDFQSVETRVELFMFPVKESLLEYREIDDKNESLVDQEDNIYHNTITSVTPLKYGGEKHDAEEIKEALNKNAREIALNIKHDLLTNNISN